MLDGSEVLSMPDYKGFQFVAYNIAPKEALEPCINLTFWWMRAHSNICCQNGEVWTHPY